MKKLFGGVGGDGDGFFKKMLKTFLAAVLLSALVKRCFVSCRRDFFHLYLKKKKNYNFQWFLTIGILSLKIYFEMHPTTATHYFGTTKKGDKSHYCGVVYI